MYNQSSTSQEELAREKALYLYISAFDRGDFDAMNSILQEAVHDPLLEELIMEVHDSYQAEQQVVIQAEDREKIRNLVLTHLPSGIWDEEDEIAIPPLTVAEVATKIQEDTNIKGSLKQEIQAVQQQLIKSDLLLPSNLNIKSIYHLFEQLGLTVSTKLQKIFREKAIFLSMAREQGIAQIAATRHQKKQHQEPKEEEEKS